MVDDDTICAISTPAGEGGIGVIRLTGPQAHSILRRIFRPKRKREVFTSRNLYLGYIRNPENREPIDEVFAVFMNSPYTYTREDVAEIYSHGGFATQKNILALMMKCGARIAEPGEFTKRAFLNGRIDLLQAESVLDVIESETDEELRCAMEHLRGKLSQKLGRVRETVQQALVEVEALIDFPEEEIEVNENESFRTLGSALKEMERLIDSHYEGRAVKYGFEVMIVGKTNVGKSSLLNALLQKERAIVTPLPGTTRDMIEDTIHIKGVKAKVIDTAGIRRPRDVVEQEGIERVKQKIPEADMVIWVLDGSIPYGQEDEEISRCISGKPAILAVNKIDLPQALSLDSLGLSHHSSPTGLQRVARVSALKDIGLDDLKEGIYAVFKERGGKSGKVLITNLRHRDALRKAKDAVERAVTCGEKGEPLEFVAFELRDSLSHLDEITGERYSDEILTNIFSRFCIGK
jgi:tRNA modification GTPase